MEQPGPRPRAAIIVAQPDGQLVTLVPLVICRIGEQKRVLSAVALPAVADEARLAGRLNQRAIRLLVGPCSSAVAAETDPAAPRFTGGFAC